MPRVYKSIIFIFILFFPPYLFAFTLFNKNLPEGAKFFVLIDSKDNEMACYCQNIIKDRLKRAGFKILNPEASKRLIEDEIIKAKIEDKDPMVLFDIHKKYEVDFTVTGKLKIDTKPLFTNRHEGMALLSIWVVSNRDAQEIGHANSEKIGIPENPGPIRESSLAAKQAAVLKVSGEIIARMGLPGGFYEIAEIFFPALLSEYHLSRPQDATAISFMPDGRELVIASGRTAYRFDIDTHKFIDTFRLPKKIKSISVSKSGRFIAFGQENGKISVLDLNTGHEYQYNKGDATIFAVCFSPKEDLLAAGDNNGYLYIWSLGNKRVISRKAHQKVKKPQLEGSQGIRALAFNWNGSFLYSAGAGLKIKKWEPESGRLLSEFDQKTLGPNAIGYITSTTFNPEGNMVGIGLYNINIRPWGRFDRSFLFFHNISGKEFREIRPYAQERWTPHINAVSFYPISSRFAACGASNGILELWDVYAYRLIEQKRTSLSSIKALCFSPDGNKLAVAGEGGVTMWSLR